MEPSPSRALLTTEGVILERERRAFASLPDLHVHSGQAVALVGPSGSGKSTAVLALAGVRKPLHGDVAIGSTYLWRLPSGDRDRFRGRRIGLVFQSFHLIDALTVTQNVAMAGHCAGQQPDPRRIDYLLDHLGLLSLGRRRPDQISHGEAQRVAVARAVFNKPSVILADEPTSSLDDSHAEQLTTMLRDLAVREAAALVIATHDARVRRMVHQTVAMDALP